MGCQPRNCRCGAARCGRKGLLCRGDVRALRKSLLARPGSGTQPGCARVLQRGVSARPADRQGSAPAMDACCARRCFPGRRRGIFHRTLAYLSAQRCRSLYGSVRSGARMRKLRHQASSRNCRRCVCRSGRQGAPARISGLVHHRFASLIITPFGGASP